MWLIAAAFFAVQVSIIGFAANGPFVDEAVYTVAGMRVLEGRGLSDGYVAWFNGSPFVWPVIAALGHRLGGLPGTRLMAAILALVTLVAFAKAAEALVGQSAAVWGTAALALNGLFMALAHFAVYDLPALTGIAVSMWCLTRGSPRHGLWWVLGAAVAFSFAVIAKYGYMPMVIPLVGLLASVRGLARAGRPLALFLSAAALITVTYFWLLFGSLVPGSASAYFEQPSRVSRGHISALQLLYGLGPLLLASVGASVAWKEHRRLLVVTCLVALSVFPAFHLWTANSVSAQKHVVPGFLFAYLLAGVALARFWKFRSRVALCLGLGLLTVWGGLQWYWQEYSWSDTRALDRYLVQHMTRGDRVVADSAWTYILALYAHGAIQSPADVIDANYSPDIDRLDLCQIPWLVGNLEATPRIRAAVARCGHRRVRSSASEQYYFDTTRWRWETYTVVVDIYRLPDPGESSR